MSNAKIEGKPKFVLARNKGFPFIFIVRSTRPKRSAKHGFEVALLILSVREKRSTRPQTAETFEVGIAQK